MTKKSSIYAYFLALVYPILANATNWQAAPVHACSFYKGGYADYFESCAEPEYQPLSCVHHHTWPRIPVQGDTISMWLPEFLIEVTPIEGKSQFASESVDAKSLKNHLEMAHKWQNRHKPWDGLAAGGEQRNGRGQFWHARMLTVPYGGLLSFSNITATPGPTKTMPLCYIGLSEFLSDQWMKGWADKPFALAWSPLLLACRTPLGRVANEGILRSNAISNGRSSMGSFPSSDTNTNLPAGCSYPVSAKQAIGLNLLGNTDALNPTVQCLGPLGGLLPRQGLIPHENRYLGAHTAAWKFASLVKTTHVHGPAGISNEDKWQLMYPDTPKKHCYRPTSTIDMALPPPEFRTPMMSGKAADSYIFAVWRKRTRCVLPPGGATWKAQMAVEIPAKKKICPAL